MSSGYDLERILTYLNSSVSATVASQLAIACIRVVVLDMMYEEYDSGDATTMKVRS